MDFVDSNTIDQELIHYQNNYQKTLKSSDIDVNTIYYEISGNCNARCKYCATGKGNFNGCPWRHIPATEFKRGLERLYHLGFLHEKKNLGLFNWGEPLLNPQIEEILRIINDHNQSFQLSTNGSIYRPLSEKLFDRLSYIRFSLHGFSQDSFQRINNLRYDVVVDNIDKWLKILPQHAVEICFFLYRFNTRDLPKAYDYFNDKGIRFTVHMPSINDFNRAYEYLTSNLDENSRLEIEKDIPTDDIPFFLKTKNADYICPLIKSHLTIDEFNNILTCCLISKKSRYYSFGSLFDLNHDEVIQKKIDSPVCNGCMQIGIPYWLMGSNELLPNFIVQQNDLSKTKNISSLYINTGRGFNEIDKEITYIQKVGEKFSVYFNLSRYSGIIEVRFDPVEYSLRKLQLDAITLFSLGNLKLLTLDKLEYISNGKWISDNVIEFCMPDPWIIIPITDKNTIGIKITGKLIFN